MPGAYSGRSSTEFGLLPRRTITLEFHLLPVGEKGRRLWRECKTWDTRRFSSKQEPDTRYGPRVHKRVDSGQRLSNSRLSRKTRATHRIALALFQKNWPCACVLRRALGCFQNSTLCH